MFVASVSKSIRALNPLQRTATNFAASLSMFLLEDFERPEMCPVAQVLALAIADHALDSIDTLDDLKAVCAPAC